ncbi:hypothetical protein LN042_24175 [Kitasatospora sp. RB6PN24]|uniref:hypothetical protein n=1 Tax=Kitasatospora humi TaxID=2893891 RepID=UPI001E408513|nr:hypothetical protein [Kitasatospora humi]MCC9310127.1 hypothetical protein [Kitasatospora humi]
MSRILPYSGTPENNAPALVGPVAPLAPTALVVRREENARRVAKAIDAPLTPEEKADEDVAYLIEAIGSLAVTGFSARIEIGQVPAAHFDAVVREINAPGVRREGGQTIASGMVGDASITVVGEVVSGRRVAA